jgi:hypothetical protein
MRACFSAFAPACKGISWSPGELRQELSRSHEELKDVVLRGNRYRWAVAVLNADQMKRDEDEVDYDETLGADATNGLLRD